MEMGNQNSAFKHDIYVVWGLIASFQNFESPPTSLISSVICVLTINGCFHQLQKQSISRIRLKMGMSLSHIASSLLCYIHEK